VASLTRSAVRSFLAFAVLAAAVAISIACGPSSTPGPSSAGEASIGPVGFRGHTVAGPVCPVVRPNDPACADRPIAGATIHVLDANGTEIARLVSDATGGFGLAVPAGTYRLVADPVEGALRAPAAATVEVGTGISEIDLAYDTGIR
jgi:hypothetical protein